MSRSTLLLLRHGHTAPNAGGLDAILSGWTDVPLSSEGLRSAERAGEIIAREVHPDAMFTSPLRRALQTARAVEQRWPVSVHIHPGLREIHCGALEGLTLSKVQKNHAREWEKNLQQNDLEFRWPGGESYREFRCRVMATLEGIAHASDGKRVLVVTHAGVISQVMGAIHGASAARWDQFRPHNCSLSEFVWSAQGPALVAFDVDLGSER